jgi:AraC-like DNA-binding protein
VARLLVAVERDPLRRYRDAELAELGIDASTARRQFKRYCGMTFQAYHRARRMGLALADIRKGKTVTDSQLDQGFESGSGFREAFTRIVGTAPSRARDVASLHAKWLETPLGSMLALADDRGLHLLDFVDRRGLERALAVLQKRLNARVLPGEHPVLAQIARELNEYFDGTRECASTPRRADRLGVPVVGMARAAIHSCWRNQLLRRTRRADRTTRGGARGGARQRRQPAVHHRAVSPCDRRRRRIDRLWRRIVAKAEAARP